MMTHEDILLLQDIFTIVMCFCMCHFRPVPHLDFKRRFWIRHAAEDLAHPLYNSNWLLPTNLPGDNFSLCLLWISDNMLVNTQCPKVARFRHKVYEFRIFLLHGFFQMADPGLPTRPQVGGLPIGSFKLLLEVRVSPQVFIQNCFGCVLVLGICFYSHRSFVPQLL